MGKTVYNQTRGDCSFSSQKSSEFKCDCSFSVKMAVLLLFIIVILLVFLGFKMTGTKDYDHTLVSVSISNQMCLSNYTCTGCTDFEKTQGCCVGCPMIDSPPYDDCGLIATVYFNNVRSLSVSQRVWLLNSLDNKIFYTSGFAPYIRAIPSPSATPSASPWISPKVGEEKSSSSTPAISGSPSYTPGLSSYSGFGYVTNGCYGPASNQVIVVACLSDEDLDNLSFDGFPIDLCNSTFGICIKTNGVAVGNIPGCYDDLWIGNNFTTSWGMKKGSLISPNPVPNAALAVFDRSGLLVSFVAAFLFVFSMVLSLL